MSEVEEQQVVEKECESDISDSVGVFDESVLDEGDVSESLVFFKEGTKYHEWVDGADIVKMEFRCPSCGHVNGVVYSLPIPSGTKNCCNGCDESVSITKKTMSDDTFQHFGNGLDERVEMIKEMRKAKIAGEVSSKMDNGILSFFNLLSTVSVGGLFLSVTFSTFLALSVFVQLLFSVFPSFMLVIVTVFFVVLSFVFDKLRMVIQSKAQSYVDGLSMVDTPDVNRLFSSDMWVYYLKGVDNE